MRNNYFEKLVNYIKRVYHIVTGLKKLIDKRDNPTYNMAQVIYFCNSVLIYICYLFSKGG